MVVGFSGGSILSHMTTLPLVKLIQKLFVDGCDFRFSLTSSMVSDYDLLRHTPVSYVIRDQEGVKTMSIGLHSTPYHAWGVVWRWCGTERCARPRDIRSSQTGSHNTIRIRQECIRCGWRSASLTTDNLSWVQRWDKAHPNVFTWRHPPSPGELMSFVTSTTKVERQGIPRVVVAEQSEEMEVDSD